MAMEMAEGTAIRTAATGQQASLELRHDREASLARPDIRIEAPAAPDGPDGPVDAADATTARLPIVFLTAHMLDDRDIIAGTVTTTRSTFFSFLKASMLPAR